MKYLLSLIVLFAAIISVLTAVVNFPPSVSGLQRLKNDIEALPKQISNGVKDAGNDLKNSVKKWVDESGVVNYTDSKYIPDAATTENVDTTVAAEIPGKNVDNDTGVTDLKIK